MPSLHLLRWLLLTWSSTSSIQTMVDSQAQLPPQVQGMNCRMACKPPDTYFCSGVWKLNVSSHDKGDREEVCHLSFPVLSFISIEYLTRSFFQHTLPQHQNREVGKNWLYSNGRLVQVATTKNSTPLCWWVPSGTQHFLILKDIVYHVIDLVQTHYVKI